MPAPGEVSFSFEEPAQAEADESPREPDDVQRILSSQLRFERSVEQVLARLEEIQRSLARFPTSLRGSQVATAAAGEGPVPLSPLSLPSRQRRLSFATSPSVQPTTPRHSVSSSLRSPSGGGVTRKSGFGGAEDEEAMAALCLEDDWPATVTLRPILSAESGDRSTRRAAFRLLTRDSPMHALDSEVSVQEQAVKRRRWRDPQLPVHLAWACLGAATLLYELSYIPWSLAWNQPPTGPLLGIAAATASYWSLDIALSFWKGYYKGADLIVDPREIVKHYLRTWCLADVTLVALDWFALIFGQDAGGTTSSKLARLVKFGKVLRILALLKVTRLAKLREAAVSMLDFLGLGDEVFIILRICQTIASIFWGIHFLCCLWFAVGFQCHDAGYRSWVGSRAARRGDTEFLDTDRTYQYLTSLHWALAQVSLGSMEIPPTNSWERLSTIASLILGMVVGSALISSLSAKMIEFRMLHEEMNSQLRLLKKYLSENGIEHHFAMAMQKQARERLADQGKLSKEQVPVLSLLSVDLQTRLHEKICIPWLQRHPLLLVLSRIDAHFLRRLCSTAANMRHVRKGDHIFGVGEPADHAFCLKAGTVQYRAEQPVEQEAVDVAVGGWLCEPALWCEWHCVGSALATSSTELLVLDAAKLGQDVENRKVHLIMSEYAEAYHDRLTSAMPPKEEYPTDLEVPHALMQDIVPAMTKSSRVIIARACVDYLDYTWDVQEAGSWSMPHGASKKQKEDLFVEVKNGTTVLAVSTDGQVKRTVSLVVLRAVRGRTVLYEVGTRSGSQVKAGCRLPASKRGDGESDAATLVRVLSRVLPAQNATALAAGALRSSDCSQDWSKSYNVATTYMRDVFTVEAAGEFDLPQCSYPQAVSCHNSIMQGIRRASDGGSELFSDLVQGGTLLFVGDEAKGAASGRYFAFLTEEEAASLKHADSEAKLHACLLSAVLPEQASESAAKAISEAASTAPMQPRRDPTLTFWWSGLSEVDEEPKHVEAPS